MNAPDIMALCSRQVSTALTTEVGWAEKGAFLPLAVWKTNGWDVAAIESKAAPENIRVDPEYGFLLYRVKIHSTQQGQKRTTDDSLQLLAKGRTRALRRKATDEVSAKSLAGGASDDRSCSDEDSDSQADSRPLARPKKQAKAKAKKEKEDPTAKKVKAAAKAAVKNRSSLECLAHNLRAQVRHGG